MASPNGTGNSSSNNVNATRSSTFAKFSGSSEGETDGVGSVFSAQLNERPNRSNNRNMGPDRAPSPHGSARIPIVTQASRNTGRVGG
jgi:hypothetical protein